MHQQTLSTRLTHGKPPQNPLKTPQMPHKGLKKALKRPKTPQNAWKWPRRREGVEAVLAILLHTNEKLMSNEVSKHTLATSNRPQVATSGVKQRLQTAFFWAVWKCSLCENAR